MDENVSGVPIILFIVVVSPRTTISFKVPVHPCLGHTHERSSVGQGSCAHDLCMLADEHQISGPKEGSEFVFLFILDVDAFGRGHGIGLVTTTEEIRYHNRHAVVIELDFDGCSAVVSAIDGARHLDLGLDDLAVRIDPGRCPRVLSERP